MINCKDCKRYNDAGQHKSCLAGKWEAHISGDVVLSPEMVECDAAEIEAIDKRTKAYKDSQK
jgi:hypothetical protein